MPIEFNCHVCGKLLRTSDEKAGRTAKCPGCGESLVVPEPEGGAAASHEPPDDEFGDEFGEDSPSAGGATKACPMCGEQIDRNAARCQFCGEELTGGGSSRSASYHKPHRGAMILTFGILSFFICPIFGIVAWVMANEDLREIETGRMDPEGEGLTKAGKIISIISLCLVAAGFLLWCIGVIFVVAIGAA